MTSSRKLVLSERRRHKYRPEIEKPCGAALQISQSINKSCLPVKNQCFLERLMQVTRLAHLCRISVLTRMEKAPGMIAETISPHDAEYLNNWNWKRKQIATRNLLPEELTMQEQFFHILIFESDF